MKIKSLVVAVVFFSSCLSTIIASKAVAAEHCNVLFIAIDDMRAWAGYLGDRAAKTPNLDRLAASGVAFTRAYTAYALCNPSRTALLTGMRPTTTGVISNGIDWREQISDDKPTLPGHFRASGYRTMGAGKIFHGKLLRSGDWDEYPKMKSEKEPRDKKNWSLKEGSTLGSFSIGSNQIVPFDAPEEELEDYQTASFGVERIEAKQDKPFFIACGFHRPHLPLVAPRKYFDMIPLDSIEAPKFKPDDLADIPEIGRAIAKPGESAAIIGLDKWRECVRAYRACIAFTDAQVGRLLEALDKSPYRDNTVVVLWSDHGWHHGEKEHWRKSTLWEEATLSPLIWRVPGLTKPNGVCERTVDFMSIYPTLCEVCDLPKPHHLEGVGFRSLLADPKSIWDRPAVSTFQSGHHSARSERYRYIRYDDGSEELYDHSQDPNEWTNLANRPEFQSVKSELAKWLPNASASSASRKKKP